MKRKRKIEFNDDGNSEEIKRQISDPVDLSQTYDSIRRRSSQFPPPPPPVTSTPPSEKGNQVYGSLSVTNNHYRSSLIAGKPSSLSTLVEGDV